MKQFVRMACVCSLFVLGITVLATEAQGQECKGNLETMGKQCCKSRGMIEAGKQDTCKKLNATCTLKANNCKTDCEKKGADCKATCEKNCKTGCEKKGADCKTACDKKGADCKTACEKKGADCKAACEKKGADCKAACEKKGADCVSKDEACAMKATAMKEACGSPHCPLGRWICDLSSLSGVKNPQLKPEKAIELSMRNGKIHGFSGVNRFFGSVSFKHDGRIVFDHMGSTRMMGRAIGYEDAFMQAMAKVKYFQVHCRRLLLKDADKNVILQFNR